MHTGLLAFGIPQIFVFKKLLCEIRFVSYSVLKRIKSST